MDVETNNVENQKNDIELKFNALFQMSTVGIAFHEMIFDKMGNPFDYRFIDVNNGFIELTGIDPRNKTVREAFPGIENDPSNWIEKYGILVKTGESARFEQHLKINDQWYDCSASRYKTNHFVVLFSKTTQHKEELTELAKLRNAMKGSNDAIFLTDKEGIITHINPGFTKIYGYTSEEVVGKVTPRIIKSGTISVEHYKQFWDVLIKKEEIRGEIKNKRKDGTIIDVEGSANAILDENGNIIGYLGIQRDITDRKKAEKKLSESLEEAEKINRIIIGRENRMIELKKEIEVLKKEIEELKK